MYKFSRWLLPVSFGFIDLAKYQWFRKKVGGTWYHVGVLVDLGRHKHFWWTKTELPSHYIRNKEDYGNTSNKSDCR